MLISGFGNKPARAARRLRELPARRQIGRMHARFTLPSHHARRTRASRRRV
jgi:hypothetical protein